MEDNKLSNKEIEDIYERAIYLKELDDSEIDEIKKISCEFFRCGSHPKVYSSECKGCLDPESVLACRGIYLDFIFDRPMKEWKQGFEAPTKREKKVAIHDSNVGLSCNSCYMSETCPMYKAGAECGIDWGSDNPEKLDEKEVYERLITIQQKRVARLSKFEEVDGGMVDMNMSSEMDRLANLLSAKKALDVQRVKFSLEAESSGGSNSGGGVLQQIFGGGNKSLPPNEQKALPQKDDSIIDAEFEEVKPEKLDNGKKTSNRRKSRRRA